MINGQQRLGASASKQADQIAHLFDFADVLIDKEDGPRPDSDALAGPKAWESGSCPQPFQGRLTATVILVFSGRQGTGATERCPE